MQILKSSSPAPHQYPVTDEKSPKGITISHGDNHLTDEQMDKLRSMRTFNHYVQTGVYVLPGDGRPPAPTQPSIPETFRLTILVDLPEAGDPETSILARRGDFRLRPMTKDGASQADTVAEVMRIVSQYGFPGERPVIELEDTSTGSQIANVLRTLSGDLQIRMLERPVSREANPMMGLMAATMQPDPTPPPPAEEPSAPTPFAPAVESKLPEAPPPKPPGKKEKGK